MKVPLPTYIQEAVDRAWVSMLQHPQYALLPLYRRAIYHALDTLDNPQAPRLRLALDLLAGRLVLPIWQEERPDDHRPEHLLNIAEGVLLGTVMKEVARIEAEIAWQWLENTDYNVHETSLRNISKRAFIAATCAVEVAFEAAGVYRFDGVLISEDDDDTALDPWCSDPAMWAVSAYAGTIGESSADPNKRKEFWEWWLQEAIPSVWRERERYE